MVNDAKASQAREIFQHVLKIDDESQRQEYLDGVCGVDTPLRQRVERLLEVRGQSADHLLLRAVGKERGGLVAAPSSVPGLLHPGLLSPTTGITAADSVPIDMGQHPMIGPYKLLEVIGEGGMGTVYMAQQTKPVKRKVALKVIKPGMDSKEVIARFEAERQALAIMDHANIARVFDGGTTDKGLPYFVMELVRGVPLTEFCKQKKLGLRDRLKLFVDICIAVQHAHQKGILHRDLKPSNLLVTMHDHLPVVKVIDFGVAKALNEELTERTMFTKFSQVLGTPLYMAPEQAQLSGLDVDTRSDIYSMGVVLYELLTETTPFDRDTIAKLDINGFRRMLQEQDPERPSARVSTLRAANQSTVNDQRRLDTADISKQLKGELDWIVMKALEKDRERRYDTANAFAADVHRYLDDEPVEACPPSVMYRMSKYVRRYKGLITAAAILLAMLITSTAVSAVFAFQANEARQEAIEQKEEAVAANQLADQHLKQSRVDFDRAIKSLDTIVDEVSSAEFAQLPGVDNVRNEILDKAMEFYGKIIAEHNNDPYARLQQARAHRKISEIHSRRGDLQMRTDELQNAIAILSKLVEEDSQDVDTGHELIRCLTARAWESTRSAEGRVSDMERALQIAKGLPTEGNPSKLGYVAHVMATLSVMLRGDDPRKDRIWNESVELATTHKLPASSLVLSTKTFRARDDGDLDSAIEWALKWVDLQNRDPQEFPWSNQREWLHRNDRSRAWQVLGELYSQQGSVEDADQAFRSAYENALAMDREYHQTKRVQNRLIAVASTYVAFLETQRRPEEALNLLKEILKQAPDLIEVHDLYAKSLAKQPAKIAALSKAIEGYPEISTYHRYRGVAYRDRAEFEEALNDLNRAVELADDKDPRAYSSRSLLFMRMKQYEKALADYDKQIQLAPDPYAYKRRALAHFELKNYKDALSDIAKAVELSPDDGSKFHWIAPERVASCPDKSFSAGMLKLADANIDRHDCASVRIGRAGLLAAMGDDERALIDYDQAVELDSDNHDWRTWRMKFFAARERWQELADELSWLNQHKPDDYFVMYQSALCSLTMGDRPKYRTDCQRMLNAPFASVDNGSVNEIYFTAWTCVLAAKAIENYEPAIKLARYVAEQDPTNQQYLGGFGAILMRTGRYDEAKEQLEKTLEASMTDKTSPSYTRYFLAMTEHHLGSADKAKVYLQAANESAEKELAQSPAWNRKLTLELLRDEAEALINVPQQNSAKSKDRKQAFLHFAIGSVPLRACEFDDRRARAKRS